MKATIEAIRVDVNLSDDSEESESDTNGEDTTATDSRLEKLLA